MGESPVPASSKLLCRYVTFLARKLCYSSIKQYINIIRIIHAEWGYPNPCLDDYELKMTLRGIKRHLGDDISRKAPITPKLLLEILSKLNVLTVKGASIWAACLLMFFGCLRRSNVLATTKNFDPTKHLRRRDFCFTDNGLNIKIRWTKTIQYKGRVLEIPYPWDRGNPLCPTQATFNAVCLSPGAPVDGPALVMDTTPSPAPLTPDIFVKEIRRALHQPGRDVTAYAGHSFRRGGATWAFTNRIDLETIRVLGDWRSQAYTAYIFPSEGDLRGAITTMVQATSP